jgi:hypothetical protein
MTRSYRSSPPTPRRGRSQASARSIPDPGDSLLHLHVRIAKRADELAGSQRGPQSRERDLRCWLQAEREILQERAAAHTHWPSLAN